MSINLFDDLYNVGKTKIIGYLALSWIYKNKKTVGHFKEYAKLNNLTLKIIKQKRFGVNGAKHLYLYSHEKLLNLIEKHKDKLTHLPSNPDEFIHFISNNCILYGYEKNKHRTEIEKFYIINDNDSIFIGLCFGNKNFNENMFKNKL
jgi:hypothetical protein